MNMGEKDWGEVVSVEPPFFVNIYQALDGTTFAGGRAPDRWTSRQWADAVPNNLNSRVRVTALKEPRP